MRIAVKAHPYIIISNSLVLFIYFYVHILLFAWVYMLEYLCCELCVQNRDRARFSEPFMFAVRDNIVLRHSIDFHSVSRIARRHNAIAARIIIFNLEIICQKLCIHGLTKASFIQRFYYGGGRAFVQKLCIQIL